MVSVGVTELEIWFRVDMTAIIVGWPVAVSSLASYQTLRAGVVCRCIDVSVYVYVLWDFEIFPGEEEGEIYMLISHT